MTLWILFFIIGCQNPNVRINSLSELPEVLQAGFNSERWYFTNAEISFPINIVKKKGISGLANPFLLPVKEKLILTTYNGYLVSMNKDNLGDVANKRIARGISAPAAFSRPLLFIPAEKGKYGLQAYDLVGRQFLWKKSDSIPAAARSFRIRWSFMPR